MKTKKKSPVSFVDINSPETVELIRQAAAAFTKRATRSKAAARAVLVKEGIITRTGRLTKNYR